MNSATKRSILRWIHIMLAIPILSYIYGPPSEVQQYASAVRLIFVPIIILSGFWMYAGVIFAITGVTLWLGAIHFFGVGTAIVTQVALFIAWKIWSGTRARQLRGAERV
jgi:hypothetical protein